MFEKLFNTHTIILNKHTGYSISVENLCQSILKYNTLQEVAKYYKTDRKIIRIRLKEHLNCYSQLNCRGNRTLRVALLEQLNLIMCNTCKELKKISEFSKTPTNTVGVRYVCKVCNRDNRNVEYHREYSKKHYLNNKAYYYNKKQLRRSKQLSATTKFGQEGLEQFYKYRPAGMHIDHIVPLNNPLVCGLHNIYNVQYLSSKDNLEKSNKFEVSI